MTGCYRSRPLPDPGPALPLSALAHPPNTALGLSDCPAAAEERTVGAHRSLPRSARTPSGFRAAAHTSVTRPRRPGDSGTRTPQLARLHTQRKGTWRQGSTGMGASGGLRTVQTSGYPGGDRRLGSYAGLSSCSVAAKQPSQLSAPAPAPGPQLAVPPPLKQGWGGCGGAGRPAAPPLPTKPGSIRGLSMALRQPQTLWTTAAYNLSTSSD